MDDIHQKFSEKFRSHWIKIAFYQEKPKDDAKRLRNVRFCEATNEAILYPVLLEEKSISCPGARHAFGWAPGFKNELLHGCNDKRTVQKGTLKTMLSRVPHFKKPFKYIGLNTNGAPDLLLSYMSPQEVMDLIKIHNNKQGSELNISLCTMMAICAGIAVRTYLQEKVSLSFGCDDSRRFADMRRGNVAVGIPKRLFNVFVD